MSFYVNIHFYIHIHYSTVEYFVYSTRRKLCIIYSLYIYRALLLTLYKAKLSSINIDQTHNVYHVVYYKGYFRHKLN